MRLFLLQGKGRARYLLGMVLRRLLLLLLGFAFFLPPHGFAEDLSNMSGSDWQEVRSRYDSGKFDDALQLLQKSEPKPNDAGYFYNLGTVYYRMGQVGRAVAYLEKANRISSGDPDIQHNLEIARRSLGKLLGSERLDPGASFADWALERLGSGELRSLLGLLILISFLIAARNAMRGSRGILSGPGSALPFGFGLAGFVSALLFYQFPEVIGAHSAAVVLDRQVVRSGPGEQFLQLTLIETGTKLRLTGASLANPPSETPSNPASTNATSRPKSEVWHQVKYSSDGIGWIKSSELIFL